MVALTIIASIFTLTACSGVDEDAVPLTGEEINVYNWGEYISNGEEGSLDVNEEFTRRTGIKVNYTTFPDNESMYAKLISGSADYDVIIPSDYMIAKLIEEGLVQKLDFSNIPNYSLIDDEYKNLEYDPTGEYSVAYTWGTVGIYYNTTMVDEEDVENMSWDILWDEKYSGEILMFSNPRDAFGVAQLKLGYSLNTTDEEELQECADVLKEQKPLVQAYVMDQIFNKMGGGEAALAPYYSGDAAMLKDLNPDIEFAVPVEGTNRFVDAMCIPASSKNKALAEKYINFMCETDIALANIEYIGYGTPHTEVYAQLDEETRNDKSIYPDESVLAKTEVFLKLPESTNKLMNDLWIELKVN